MEKNYILRILSVTCLALSVVIFSACENDEEKNNGKVTLLSFGPAGVKHGETIKFIGINLDKVTAIVLPQDVEIPSSEFVSRSSALIELTIPDAAEAGIVLLRTPDGDIETKTPLNFEVPVEIATITSEMRPGSNITITGSKLNWIEEIVFPRDISVKEFVSKSLTQLVVTVPINAQSGFLVFKSGGTKPLTFAAESELKVTLPAITSFTSSARHESNITITGTDLDLVTAIVFTGNKTVSEFVSQSATEIVVTVPAGVLKGKITLKQASPVDVVSSGDFTVVLPLLTNLAPKPAKPGIDNVTLTGTDLDLVVELTVPSAPAIPKTSFVSQSTTQIVFMLPAGAKGGGVQYKTQHAYSGTFSGVTLTVPGVGPPPLAISLYDETLAPGGGDWSWDKVISDNANTEQAYSGTKSWKYTTTNGGGLSSGGITPINASGEEVFTFAIYGGPGTEGKQCAAILNDKWDSYNSVTLHEGKWTKYQIPLSQYATVDKNAIVRWALKVEGMSSSLIYADRIGFEEGGPTPLPVSLFDEGFAPGGGDWSWDKVVSDPANTEQKYLGNVSWKFQTNNSGGLSSGGITAVDASGQTFFSFALYGGPGTNGKQVAAILNDKWDSYNAVTIVEGAWTEFKVPLANYGTVDKGAIVRFAFKVEGMSSSVIYADRVGFE